MTNTTMTFSPRCAPYSFLVRLRPTAFAIQVVSLLILALGVVVLGMDTLPSWYCLALVLLGPCLTLLDTKQSTVPRTLYWGETYTRALVLAGLQWRSIANDGMLYVLLFQMMSWVAMLTYVTDYIRLAPKNMQEYPSPWVCSSLMLVLFSSIGFIHAMMAFYPIIAMLALSGMVFATVLFWRHLLWTHPQQQACKEQNKTIWSKLAASKSPHDFWNDVHAYSQTHGGLPEILPHLSFPILLSFFTIKPCNASTNVDLRESIKAAINEKEPRAVFVWELYNDRRAAEVIGDLDTYLVATRNDHLDLPTL